jgi:hypothetical protein
VEATGTLGDKASKFVYGLAKLQGAIPEAALIQELVGKFEDSSLIEFLSYVRKLELNWLCYRRRRSALMLVELSP